MLFSVVGATDLGRIHCALQDSMAFAILTSFLDSDPPSRSWVVRVTSTVLYTLNHSGWWFICAEIKQGMILLCDSHVTQTTETLARHLLRKEGGPAHECPRLAATHILILPIMRCLDLRGSPEVSECERAFDGIAGRDLICQARTPVSNYIGRKRDWHLLPLAQVCERQSALVLAQGVLAGCGEPGKWGAASSQQLQ